MVSPKLCPFPCIIIFLKTSTFSAFFAIISANIKMKKSCLPRPKVFLISTLKLLTAFPACRKFPKLSRPSSLDSETYVRPLEMSVSRPYTRPPHVTPRPTYLWSFTVFSLIVRRPMPSRKVRSTDTFSPTYIDIFIFYISFATLKRSRRVTVSDTTPSTPLP